MVPMRATLAMTRSLFVVVEKQGRTQSVLELGDHVACKETIVSRFEVRDLRDGKHLLAMVGDEDRPAGKLDKNGEPNIIRANDDVVMLGVGMNNAVHEAVVGGLERKGCNWRALQDLPTSFLPVLRQP